MLNERENFNLIIINIIFHKFIILVDNIGQGKCGTCNMNMSTRKPCQKNRFIDFE